MLYAKQRRGPAPADWTLPLPAWRNWSVCLNMNTLVFGSAGGSRLLSPALGPPRAGSGAGARRPRRAPSALGVRAARPVAADLRGRVKAAGTRGSRPPNLPQLGSDLPTRGEQVPAAPRSPFLASAAQPGQPPRPRPPSLPPLTRSSPGPCDPEHSSGRALAHLAAGEKGKRVSAALGFGSNTPATAEAKPRQRRGRQAGNSGRPGRLPSPGLPSLPITPPSLPRPFLLFSVLSEAAERSGAESQPGWRGPSKHATYFVYRGFL